jgi:putative DNA primase/helicase
MPLDTSHFQTFFRQAVAEHGLNPPAEIIPDGRIHRFSSNGKRGDLSCWYVLYPNEGRRPVGVFGDWRQGFNQTWTMDGTNTLTEAEKQDLKAKMKALIEADKQAKQAAHAAAALTCTARWDGAAPANNHHPYLARKAVLSHGTRVEPFGLLLVPVCADLENTRIQSLQTIAPDGSKRFVSGGQVKGGFFAIGSPSKTAKTVVIAEGFATAATIHEATGLPVIVAFNSGNLQAVCTAIHRLLPDALLVVAADDDWMTCPNTGIESATQAALSVGGVMVKPWFDLRSRTPKATDFNDMAMASGLDAVRDVFDGVLSDEGV